MRKITAILILCISMILLASCGGNKGDDKDSSSKIPENPGNVYRVIAVDESAAPVQGVTVQFCSDQLCIMGETGEDGIAVFEDREEGSYTVHIYAVPEGFAEDTEEYKMPDTYGDLTITLKKAN